VDSNIPTHRRTKNGVGTSPSVTSNKTMKLGHVSSLASNFTKEKQVDVTGFLREFCGQWITPAAK
jgi:hypothetical protein